MTVRLLTTVCKLLYFNTLPLLIVRQLFRTKSSAREAERVKQSAVNSINMTEKTMVIMTEETDHLETAEVLFQAYPKMQIGLYFDNELHVTKILLYDLIPRNTRIYQELLFSMNI